MTAASAAAMAVQACEPVVAPGRYQFHLPIRTEEDLRLFVAVAFGVVIPDTPTCPTHTTPWRAFADAYFARSPVCVWKASRGFGGKSFLLSLLGITEALTLGADTNVLGGSGEQSERVLEHMTTLLDRPNAPRHALAGDIAREMKLCNGSRVRSLMASSRSVRGPHPQRLRIDEADECALAIIDAALGQPMSRPGITANTVLSSTHHYPDGAMTELLRRAAERSWPVYEWCWRETQEPHGWLTQTQIAATRATVPAFMWEAEYDLQEPSPESRAIMPASVAAMFKRELGVFAGEPRQYVEIEAPVSHAEYVTGCDWAKERDWTIIVTLRRMVPNRWRLVAFERLGREPYPAMVARFDDRIARFRGVAAYDQTGLGSVVKDIIKSQARGVIMAGRDRADLISNYIGAIERSEIESPFIAHMEAEHRLASRAIYQSGDEHLPDTIAAGALAWSLSRTKPMTIGAY